MVTNQDIVKGVESLPKQNNNGKQRSLAAGAKLGLDLSHMLNVVIKDKIDFLLILHRLKTIMPLALTYHFHVIFKFEFYP